MQKCLIFPFFEGGLRAGRLIGESGTCPVDMVPQDLREPFQRQRVIRISHLSSF